MTNLLDIANRTANNALHIAKITKNIVNTKKRNKYKSSNINNYTRPQSNLINKPVNISVNNINNNLQYDTKIELSINESRDLIHKINTILYPSIKNDVELVDKDLLYILENKYDYNLISEIINFELRDDLDQLLMAINKNVVNSNHKTNYIESIKSIQIKLDNLIVLFQKVSINETIQKLENKIKQNESYQAKLITNRKINMNQLPWFRNISGTKKKEISTNFNVKIGKLNSTIKKSKKNLTRLKNIKKNQQTNKNIKSIINSK
jgi:hypothetical protein